MSCMQLASHTMDMHQLYQIINNTTTGSFYYQLRVTYVYHLPYKYLTKILSPKDSRNNHSFIHSIGMCRMWRFLAVLMSFFQSSLLYNLSFHPFPPTSLPSSLTSFCHLFLGLPLGLIVSKFIYKTFFGNSISFHSLYMLKPKKL